MRGTLAKKIRKKVYGDKDFRERTHTDIIHHKFEWGGKTYTIFTRICDKERRWYQNTKKVYQRLKKEKKNESNSNTDIR